MDFSSMSGNGHGERGTNVFPPRAWPSRQRTAWPQSKCLSFPPPPATKVSCTHQSAVVKPFIYSCKPDIPNEVVYKRDIQGSALHVAVRADRLDSVKMLLGARGDARVADADGLLPIQVLRPSPSRLSSSILSAFTCAARREQSARPQWTLRLCSTES